MTITDTSPATDAPGHESGSPEPVEVDPGSSAGTDHKVIGTLFVAASLVFLVAGGALAMVMRAQVSGPDLDVVGGNTYRQLFTMHGVMMVFLFLLPLWLGLVTAIVPLQIGASRMAFPRVHALSLWLFIGGAAMVAAAPVVSDVVGGWTLSTPLPEGAAFHGKGVDLLILGLAIVAVAAITVAINVLATVLQLRAPGLTMARIPLFSWSATVSAGVMLLALPVLVAALLLLFVDRHYGGQVFNGFTGSRGGNPLLWPRLFWFAAYPLLWALLLPALGAVSDIVPVFARRRLFSHPRAVVALGAIGVLSFAGWGSEVANLRRARPLFALGVLLVLLPVASLVLNWLGTAATAVRQDKSLKERLRTVPMLHVRGTLGLLLLGLAGELVAGLDAGGRSHRNYWGIATQHSLFFGAALVGAVAALYFWAPKLWGRHLSEKLGKLQFLALTGGLLLTALPMFVLGIQDMGAHTSSYVTDSDWGPANLVASVGGAIVVLGVLLLILNLLVSVVAGKGEAAGSDPWGGHTLEWSTTSPPPADNFRVLPEVRSETPLLDLDQPETPA
ncbi:MAG: cytochrome c oxidase subunit [Actinomycetota bacterium]|nr:cytochrome c oxidase subunit [Actinomycetota bacterium]